MHVWKLCIKTKIKRYKQSKKKPSVVHRIQNIKTETFDVDKLICIRDTFSLYFKNRILKKAVYNFKLYFFYIIFTANLLLLSHGHNFVVEGVKLIVCTNFMKRVVYKR